MSSYKKLKPRPNKGLLLGTGLLLILAFLAVIILFFIFSALTPTLVGPCVAVVDMNVPLTVEGSPPSLFDEGYPSSEELAYTIKSLNSREDVGAVVFVVNSPGGTVVATGEVYRAVDELEKPSVSYFREIAASGAYYVAVGTDYIVSDPNALTGSIGVVSTTAQMSGLLQNLGINVTTIKSGEHKDLGSPYRNMTEEEKNILQGIVDEVYQEFRSIILENREDKLDMGVFDNVTDGRLLTGRQAYEAGLVDELGTKRDAVLKAAELAGMPSETIEDVRVCYVPTAAPEGGLLSVEGIIGALEMESEAPSLSYE